MDLLTNLAFQLPLRYLQFALYVIYGGAGISKLLPMQQKAMSKKFSSFPKWFWNAAAAWEVTIVALYALGLHIAALNMSYVVMGGVLYATVLTTKTMQVSLLQQTFGLAMIPVILHLYTYYKDSNDGCL